MSARQRAGRKLKRFSPRKYFLWLSPGQVEKVEIISSTLKYFQIDSVVGQPQLSKQLLLKNHFIWQFWLSDTDWLISKIFFSSSSQTLLDGRSSSHALSDALSSSYLFKKSYHFISCLQTWQKLFPLNLSCKTCPGLACATNYFYLRDGIFFSSNILSFYLTCRQW